MLSITLDMALGIPTRCHHCHACLATLRRRLAEHYGTMPNLALPPDAGHWTLPLSAFWPFVNSVRSLALFWGAGVDRKAERDFVLLEEAESVAVNDDIQLSSANSLQAEPLP